MKVKVSPPFEGAGSFVVEVESCQTAYSSEDCGEVTKIYILADGATLPASWCEPIPEITPEEGDIVEDFDGDIFVVEAVADGIYFRHNGVSIIPSRVLARKPMGGLDAHDAIGEFYRDISEADTASAEVIAYNKFLSAILGVPYARVDK